MIAKKLLPAFVLLVIACSCADEYEKLNRHAAKEYLIPVRPASEGRNPCWNKFAKKFMYAPAPVSQKRILSLIKNNPTATIPELGKLSGFSSSRVSKIIPELKNIGLIERMGSNKSGYWKII